MTNKEAETFPKVPNKTLSIAFDFGNNDTIKDNLKHLKVFHSLKR